jgi:hypothetical protein
MAATAPKGREPKQRAAKKQKLAHVDCSSSCSTSSSTSSKSQTTKIVDDVPADGASVNKRDSTPRTLLNTYNKLLVDAEYTKQVPLDIRICFASQTDHPGGDPGLAATEWKSKDRLINKMLRSAFKGVVQKDPKHAAAVTTIWEQITEKERKLKEKESAPPAPKKKTGVKRKLDLISSATDEVTQAMKAIQHDEKECDTSSEEGELVKEPESPTKFRIQLSICGQEEAKFNNKTDDLEEEPSTQEQ